MKKPETQAITGLCANETFVVTASADRHVRAWRPGGTVPNLAFNALTGLAYIVVSVTSGCLPSARHGLEDQLRDRISFRTRRSHGPTVHVWEGHSGALRQLAPSSMTHLRDLQVWPLDFGSFYLHALHETAVTGIDVSLDGRQACFSGIVACRLERISGLKHVRFGRLRASGFRTFSAGRLSCEAKNPTLRLPVALAAPERS